MCDENSEKERENNVGDATTKERKLIFHVRYAVALSLHVALVERHVTFIISHIPHSLTSLTKEFQMVDVLVA